LTLLFVIVAIVIVPLAETYGDAGLVNPRPFGTRATVNNQFLTAYRSEPVIDACDKKSRVYVHASERYSSMMSVRNVQTAILITPF